jgi:NAD+ synthase (glutamine-hydrolysing)
MTQKIRIIMAQLNFYVGDIRENTRKIIEGAVYARDELQADVIVFPELALCGYPPEDLLLRSDFYAQNAQALINIQQAISGIDVVVGHPHKEQTGCAYNAVSVIRHSNVIARYYKQCLPNYGVFDDKRYFLSGSAPGIFNIKGLTVAVLICEDIWYPEPVAQAVQAGAQLILCANASPFELDKSDMRLRIMHKRIEESNVPIVYVNGIGGQDDLVFDGGSLVMDRNGKICVHGGFYEEKLVIADIDVKAGQPLQIISSPLPFPMSLEAKMYQALVLSVRDYIEKNGFPGALIGLSGGIDSALTLAIAVDAIGKDRVQAVILPSRYTSDLSMQLANEMVACLEIKSIQYSIESSFNAFLTTLAPEFEGLPADKTEENLQARCRGVIMMALSNKTGKLVLTTGNKSEMAVGYATLYGDMAGGFAVLKDVFKTWVYRLARYRNAISPVIPLGIIKRPPTAELAHDQKDEDTLPPYVELDQILKLYVEEDRSIAEIVAVGFSKDIVQRVINMVDKSEYKRRQSPIGPRITARTFGRERRYPITSKYQQKDC